MIRRQSSVLTPVQYCGRWLLGLVAGMMVGCEHAPPSSGARPSAAGPSRPALTLRDYAAEPIIEPGDEQASPMRIISAAPNITELCCALGAGGSLVARTDYCQHPASVQSLPSIGALLQTNIERILELKPDLILISGASRLITDRLAPLGLQVESLPDTRLEDLFISIERLGARLGQPHTAGRLTEAIRTDLRRVSDQYRGQPRRVLICTGTMSTPPAPVSVAGGGSFYDDLLALAGHQNAAPEGHPPFAPLSLEAILDANPDVIIELEAEPQRAPRTQDDAVAAWSNVGALQAVTSRRIHVLTGGRYYLLGPRIAAIYADLAAAISVESTPR